MKPESKSADVPKDTRTVHDNLRINNPYRRTIRDARLRGALVTYANSTRY
jgi:hypothetical protein